MMWSNFGRVRQRFGCHRLEQKGPYHRVSAIELHVHVGPFAGDAILCLNFFCFPLLLTHLNFKCLVSFIKI